jgi:hypothetical protein
MAKLKKRILTGFFVPLLSSFVLLLSSFVSLPSSLAYAEIPRLINYQGRLVDKDTQKPAEGLYVMKFTLYDEPGAIKWQATYGEGEGSTPVSVSKGVFSVKLGEITDKGSPYKFSDLSFDEPYYLEIAVRKNEPNSQFETLGSRQPLTSAGYAIRAEQANNAEEAKNAATVANIGVSVAPAPNKLLPLDNNAKLPLASLALKVYDSGWFAVSAASSYSKTHNLGTNKLLINLWCSSSSDGSNAIKVQYIHEQDAAGGTTNIGGSVVELTNTSVTLKTGGRGVAGWLNGTGQWSSLSSGYYRVIAIALE